VIYASSTRCCSAANICVLYRVSQQQQQKVLGQVEFVLDLPELVSNVATMKKFLLATLLIVLGSRGVCTMKKYIQYETQKPNLVPFGLSENVRKQTPGLAHKALF
jgi:hypothetical protein